MPLKGTLQKDGTYSFPPCTRCMDCGCDCDVWEEVNIEWHAGGKKDYWCYCKKCNTETFHPASGYKTEDASDI